MMTFHSTSRSRLKSLSNLKMCSGLRLCSGLMLLPLGLLSVSSVTPAVHAEETKPTPTPTTTPATTPTPVPISYNEAQTLALAAGKAARTKATELMASSKTLREESDAFSKELKEVKVEAAKTIEDEKPVALETAVAKVEQKKATKLIADKWGEFESAKDEAVLPQLAAAKKLLAASLPAVSTDPAQKAKDEADPVRRGITAEIGLIDTAVTDLAKEKGLLVTAGSDLRVALLGVRTTLTTVSEAVHKSVTGTLPKTDPERVNKLPADLTGLRDGYRFHKIVLAYYAKRDAKGEELDTSLRKRLQTLIQALPAPSMAAADAPADVDPLPPVLTKLRTDWEAKLGALGDHYGKVKAYLVAQSLEIGKRSLEFEQDSRPSSRRIVQAQGVRETVTTEAQAVSDAMARQETLENSLTGEVTLKDVVAKNRQAAEELARQLDSFENAGTLLEELLHGDRSNWIGEQVTLYYFGEVDRLIRTLNPNMKAVGGLAEVEEKAGTARRALTETELSIQAESDNVERLKRRQKELEAEMGTVEAKFKAAAAKVLGLTRVGKRSTTRYTEAVAARDAAKVASEANPSNPSLKRTLTMAEEKVKELDQKALKDGETLEDATAQETETKAKYESLKDETTGLPAEIESAKGDLVSAQGRMRQLSRDAYLQAQDDLNAFAKARDNRPFLFGPPQPFSADPAQRVALYGYADSKTIFMRGAPQDVARVSDLIAIFDRPTPQARLTLWTLELDGQANQGGAEKFNNAVARVEERLADVRAGLLTATSILRDCVNKNCNTAALSALSDGSALKAVTDDAQLARYSFYANEVVERLSLDPKNRLNLSAQDVNFLKANLPDPAGTTTFGEALMVLALAKPKYQGAVLDEFEIRLREEMPSLMERNRERKDKLMDPKSRKDANRKKPSEFYPQADVWFSSLRAALGFPSKGNLTNDSRIPSAATDLTARQLEILRALKRVALERLVNDAKRSSDGVNAILIDNKSALNEEDIDDALQINEEFKRNLKWIVREHPELVIDTDDLDKRISALAISNDDIPNASKAKADAIKREQEARDKSFRDTKSSQAANREVRDAVRAAGRAVERAVTVCKSVNATGSIIDSSTRAAINVDRLLEALQTQSNLVAGQTSNGSSEKEATAKSYGDRIQDSSNQADRSLTNLFTALKDALDDADQLLQLTTLSSLNRHRVEAARAGLKGALIKLGRIKAEADQLGEKALEAQRSRIEATEAVNAINSKVEEAERASERHRNRIRDAFTIYIPLLEAKTSSSATNARIAAADQMLKEVITAAEDDLDRHFVRPMLSNLRTDIQGGGINVGLLNRTSVLASNRAVARVDPTASSQLEVGATTDLLDATRQYMALYGATQVPGVASVVNALGAQSQKDETGLYGITSGAKFEVTPVIDPSGQALRFKFDYVLQNQLRQPDGSIDPQLSRVTRHTINTEVQLSNLEIRNISQFEANTKIGLPTKFSGGLPILRDLPGLREVPIIGWFKRRAGKAASIQQSVILAQTTIYPTIGDISGLLAPTTARSFASTKRGSN